MTPNKMFHKVRLIVTGVFLMVCSGAFGQTYFNEDALSLTDRAILNNVAATNAGATNSQNFSTSSSVYISQIGNYNSTQVTTAGQAYFNLYQIGNRNDIGINLAARASEEKVLQLGSDNLFLDFRANPNALMSTTVIQRGTHQSLVMYGNNSLSDKMIVRMSGKSQTLIVRNFK